VRTARLREALRPACPHDAGRRASADEQEGQSHHVGRAGPRAARRHRDV